MISWELEHNAAGVMQQAFAAGTRRSPTAGDLITADGTADAPGATPVTLPSVSAAEGRFTGHSADPLALDDYFAGLAEADALTQAFALATQRRR